MSGTKYPYQIDGASELILTTDNVTTVKAQVVNDLRGAIIAIEAELGLDPSREYSTVRARLDAMSAIIASLQSAGGGGNADLTTLPPTNITKSAAQVGSIQLAALSDHKHDISTASATTVGTLNSEGNSSFLARADHTHAVSGLNIAGQTQGSILYHNGTSWVVLNPGQDGYVLTTHSVSNNPTWTEVSSGSGVNLTNSAPVDVTKSAAVVGVSTTAARSDHKHDISTAAPSNIGNANTEGSATSLARSDHIHALAGTVGGDLSGTLPNPTVVNFHIPGATTNSILYYNGSSWVILNAGQDGYVLTTHSTGAAPQWTSLPEGVALGVVAPIDIDKNPAVIGVSARSAHEDHKHSIVTAAATSVGATNAEGTAISMARSDHKHAVTDLAISSQAQGDILYFNGSNWVRLPASTDGFILTTHSTGANPTWSAAPTGVTLTNSAPVNVNVSTAVIGVATTAARSDHKHNIDVATAVSVGATNSQGSSTSLARADHTHAVTDLSITSQTQGSILYFNGTNWVQLAPSTDGAVLTTHSVSANPTWTLLNSSSIINSSTVTGATVTNALNTLNTAISNLPLLTSISPVNVTKSTAAVGVSTNAARADHKHDISTASAISTGTSNSEGVATTLARSDHTHAVTALSITGQVQGDILYFNGTNWVRLAPSTDGFILTTHSTGADPTWAAPPTGVGLSGLLPVDVDANPASAGVGISAARYDHKHNISTGTGTSIGAINAIGTATSLSRSDHKHAVTDLAISGQAQGDILYFNGSNWVRLPAGTSGNVLTTNGVGANPIWNPVAALTSIPPVNVNASAAVLGVATTAARSDHKHNIDVATAVSIGAVNAQGSSTSLARADHTHAVTDLNMTSQTQGSILYFNGANWVVLGPSTDGFILTTHSTGANPTWSAAPTGVTLTSSAPVNVDTNAAVVGVATTAARADHKHNITTGVAVNISNVNAAGTAVSLARSDHTHAGVFSFNGRLGPVVPTTGDYNSSQITNSASFVSGSNVSNALDNLYNKDLLEYKNCSTSNTTAFTVNNGHIGNLIILTNAGTVTITLPDSTSGIPIGSKTTVRLAGSSLGVFTTVVFSPAPGVSINNPGSLNVYSASKLYALYDAEYINTNEWTIKVHNNPVDSSSITNSSILVSGSSITNALNTLYNRDSLEFKSVVPNSASSINIDTTHIGQLVHLTASGTVTVTFPNNSSGIPVGSRVTLFLNAPTVNVNIVAGSGATVSLPGSYNINVATRRFTTYEVDYIAVDWWRVTINNNSVDSSSITNLSTVSGADLTSALNSLKGNDDLLIGAYANMIIPLIPLQGTAFWSGGITNDYLGQGAGGSLGVALPLYPGFKLTAVFVSIEPQTGHPVFPFGGMPAVSVYATSNFSHTSPGIAGSANDSSGSQFIYENQHTITVTLGTPLTTSNTQTAWVRIIDESGPNALTDLRLKWIRASYIPI